MDGKRKDYGLFQSSSRLIGWIKRENESYMLSTDLFRSAGEALGAYGFGDIFRFQHDPRVEVKWVHWGS